MEDFKKVTKYWRNSLVDKRFGQGKFTKKQIKDNFINNTSFFTNYVQSQSVLQKLLLGFQTPFITSCYIPKGFKKMASHLQNELDISPELFFPISIKVEVSSCGFIYPGQSPIIPRDLLSPLDQEDYNIGNLKDYDLYISKNQAPCFNYQSDYSWEKYYKKEIEPIYLQGLAQELLNQKVITNTQFNNDKLSLIQDLYITANPNFKEVLANYNKQWDLQVGELLSSKEGFLQVFQEYDNKWKQYLLYIDNLLQSVIKDHSVLENYLEIEFGGFVREFLDVSGSIVGVYDDLYKRKTNKNELLLYKNFANLKTKEEKTLEDSTNFFVKRVGHNNNQFPLAKAQRDSISSLLAISNGEVLPVNGPPGTGKTTMVLSVVASLWVSKALEQTQPAVIIATSTNNQAVTNIIDAFFKDFSTGVGLLYSRWLPEVNSFGSYFASSKNAGKAKSKGYMVFEDFKSLESESYFNKALMCFIQKASEFFQVSQISLKKAKESLHDLLQSKYKILQDLEKFYKKYNQSKQRVYDLLELDPSYCPQELTVIEDSLGRDLFEVNHMEDLWQEYLAKESLLDTSLSFVSALAKKRNAKAVLYAKKNNFGKFFNFTDFDVATFDKVIESYKNLIAYKMQQITAFKKVTQQLEDFLESLDLGLNITDSFESIDQKMDTTVRFEMFWIATHYWEARWLLDMQELVSNSELASTGYSFEKYKKAAWYRQMKITPCCVMTSFMLPLYVNYSRKLQNNVTKTDYLYDFIDLLIVDEAGQVSPEVAGASFAFAKKSLVIGDIQQIPPINSLTKSIDIGNLQDVGLLSDKGSIEQLENDYEQLQDKGITTNKGSVMRVSQHKTAYIPQKDLQRGMYLYEHRRCYNQIIAFCNELCYQGVLQPCRADAPKSDFLPAMGYLHIDGKCETFKGSRVNNLEAKLIAGWIINNYQQLLDQYPTKQIKDIIGVVTPFKQQSNAVSHYLRQAKDQSLVPELKKITVGTVHSLQGAERNVVIFSPTYSIHQSGSFINNDPSMLNVAVSRAKDSFLVFGDMSLFNANQSTPCGILAKYLYAHSNNKLIYKHQYHTKFIREDLVVDSNPVQTLTDYQAHDVFLKEILKSANKRVIIVSPWLIYRTIESNDYMDLLTNSSLKITIYTDRRFNTFSNNKPSKAKQSEFQQAVSKLQGLGVEVIVTQNVHSKIVIKDEDCICVGSFNWFSAHRGGPYTNTEHSLVYSGDSVKTEIDKVLQQLA
ncbi:AAA domain-containing protein [Myroides sp. LJL119]